MFPGYHGYHSHQCFQAVTVTTFITVFRLSLLPQSITVFTLSRLPQSSPRALRKLTLEWKNTTLNIVLISVVLESWKSMAMKLRVLACFWRRVITEVTRLRNGQSEVWIPVGARNISFLSQRPDRLWRQPPDSCSTGTGLVRGGKAAGTWS